MEPKQKILSTPELLEKAISYLPFASVLIIIGGIGRLIIYYNFFGIDITQYIDLSEVVVFFINDLIQAILFVGLLLPVAISIDLLAQITFGRSVMKKIREMTAEDKTHLDTQKKEIEKLTDIEEKEKLIDELRIHFDKRHLESEKLFDSVESSLPHLWSRAVLSFTLSLLILLSSFFFHFTSDNYITVLIMYILSVAVLYLYYKYNKENMASMLYLLFAIIIINYFIMAFIPSYIRGHHFKDKKYLHSNAIELKGKIIKPYEKEYLVGKTKSFIFTFNDSTNQPQVYPSSVLIKMHVDYLPYTSERGILYGISP